MPDERREAVVTSDWREVPGWPGFSASTDGQLRGSSGRVLRGTPDHGGYLRVSYLDQGRQRKAAIHSLVALAFHGERPATFHVDHIDGDKQNNRPANLRYVSQTENEANKIRHGKATRGERNSHNKLSRETVLELRRAYPAAPRGWLTQQARALGVSPVTVLHIVTRKIWAWLDADGAAPHPKDSTQSEGRR